MYRCQKEYSVFINEMLFSFSYFIGWIKYFQAITFKDFISFKLDFVLARFKKVQFIMCSNFSVYRHNDLYDKHLSKALCRYQIK